MTKKQSDNLLLALASLIMAAIEEDTQTPLPDAVREPIAELRVALKEAKAA